MTWFFDSLSRLDSFGIQTTFHLGGYGKTAIFSALFFPGSFSDLVALIRATLSCPEIDVGGMKMQVISRIKADMTQPNFDKAVNAIQGDGNTRCVEVTLLANGKPWVVPPDAEVAIAYTKPDGTMGLYNRLADDTPAITVDGAVVTAVFAPQMLTVPGTVQAGIVINNTGLDQLTTFPFSVFVARNPFAGAQKSEGYVRLQWLEDKMDEYLRIAANSGLFDGPQGPQGEKGEKGDTGEQGPQGEKGDAGSVESINSLSPDASGNVSLSASDVGALPATGGDMTGEIRMNGQPISGLNDPVDDTQAARKGYVDTVVRKAAPRNLLDNSDFTNLIAQAGIGGKHGTQAYAADRWIMTSGAVSYKEGTGLTLNGTITQKLEHAPDIATPVVGTASGTASISYADGAVTITSSGGVIRWAALYTGEYTAETLPEYQPKGYAAELLECQRYYYKVPGGGTVSYHGWIFSSSIARLTVPLPTPLRIKPTVTVSTLSNANLYTANTVSKRVDSVAVGELDGNAVSLIMNGTYGASGIPIIARFNTTVSLSADL
ncbi:MAG: BppU family phage baseplate upper protein [Firmicutes bacterium]|nr:BppU family phage baseplate upper protein [Bacillota bacterium]